MEEKHYVIQWLRPVENKWESFPTKYTTLIAAREAAKRSRYPLGKTYRIAESYTIVRYKPVKINVT